MEFVEVALTRKGAVAMRQPLFLCLIQEKSHVHRQGKDILGIANVVIPIFQGNFLKNFLFFNGILSMSVYSTMRWDIFCLDVMIF